jgi:hypothetical protein
VPRPIGSVGRDGAVVSGQQHHFASAATIGHISVVCGQLLNLLTDHLATTLGLGNSDSTVGSVWTHAQRYEMAWSISVISCEAIKINTRIAV